MMDRIRTPALLVIVVLAAYFGAWSPLRAIVVTHTLAPVATILASLAVEPLPGHGATLVETGQQQRWQAPGGLLLLFGCLALAVVAAPQRLFGVLFLAHLAVGLASFTAFVAAARGAAWGGAAQAFADTYLVVGITLAIAALAASGARGAGHAPATRDTSGARSLEIP
jgi:hypothetical protein